MFDFSYSILSCFKNKWDRVKRPENVWECVRHGVQATVSSWIPVATTAIVALGLALVVNSYNPTVFKTDDQSFDLEATIPLFYRVIEGPIREEFRFRFITQNGIYCLQEAVKEVLPSKIQTNRIFEWFASPGFRALSSGAIFASAHLGNAGGYLSSAGGAVQVLRILALPVESIVFEQARPVWKVKEDVTDLARHALFPFIASCASHIANNIFAAAPLEAIIGCLFLAAVQKKFAASPISKDRVTPRHNPLQDIPEGCHFS